MVKQRSCETLMSTRQTVGWHLGLSSRCSSRPVRRSAHPVQQLASQNLELAPSKYGTARAQPVERAAQAHVWPAHSEVEMYVRASNVRSGRVVRARSALRYLIDLLPVRLGEDFGRSAACHAIVGVKAAGASKGLRPSRIGHSYRLGPWMGEAHIETPLARFLLTFAAGVGACILVQRYNLALS